MQGRGDLHLSLILEKMRREGYEFAITPPQIMFRMEKGSKLEPIESFSAVVDLNYVSTLIEKMNFRCAEYIGCTNADDDKQKLTFTVPTRGMIGLRSEIVNETRGQAIMESSIVGYEPYRGALKRQQRAPLVANHDGVCTSYGINNCEKLGNMFVKPGQKVYAGMVVGEAQNEQEVETNPVKEKRFTNVRSAGVDEAIKLSPPRIFEINEALAYIRDDEIVEITPKNLRMRKKELNPSIRKVLKRQNKSSEAEYN
jgi:GTP-binding protein